MTSKLYKWRKVAAGALAVLSLFVSTVAACACTHHHPEKVLEAVETSSCHSESHETGVKKQEPSADHFADASCECILDAPSRVFVKSEKLKIEKQAIVSTIEDSDLEPVLKVTMYLSAGYYTPRIFVPDPFYNLTPGRAPPRI